MTLAMKDLQYFKDIISKALGSDSDGRTHALADYLLCINEISTHLMQKFEDDDLFSNDSEKLVRMLCSCTDRFNGVYQEKRKKVTLDSAKNVLQTHPDSRNVVQAAKSSAISDPINRAVQENTKLYFSYRSKVSNGHLTAADMATLNMNLQRKMMENIEVAKQQRNLMETRRLDRRALLSEKIKDETLSDEFKELFIDTSAFEEEVPELRLYAQTLREQPSIDLGVNYVRTVFEYVDHPLTMRFHDCRSRLVVKLSRLVESFAESGGADVLQRMDPDGVEDDAAQKDAVNRISNSQLMAELSDLIVAASLTETKNNSDQVNSSNAIFNDTDATTMADSAASNKTEQQITKQIDFDDCVVSYKKSWDDVLQEGNLEDTPGAMVPVLDEVILDPALSSSEAVCLPKRQPSQVDRDVQALVAEIREEMRRNCEMLLHCSSLREVRRTLSEFERSFIHEVCENAVVNYHFAVLYEPLLNVFRYKTEREQRCLRLCQSGFSHTGLAFLGLEGLEASDVCDRFLEKFVEVTAETNPDAFLMKYANLKRSSNKSNSDEDQADDCSMNADNLVCYLCLIILRVNDPARVVPVFALAENFVAERKLLSEEGYCLTATITAIRYLMSLVDQK